MQCTKQLPARILPDGSLKILRQRSAVTHYSSDYLQLPCGGCISCRINYSENWALRCLHELQTHDTGCFLTLTYAPQHVPTYRDNNDIECQGTLDKTHFQKFINLLRYHSPNPLRYFYCGEYGEKLSRPHYHALIFGFKPTDLEQFGSKKGIPLYTSPQVSDIWGKGYVTVSDLNYYSAAYTARYILKKMKGEKSKEHYNGRLPEFVNMSTDGGIGKKYYEKYKHDFFMNGKCSVEIDGEIKHFAIPRYYKKLFKQEFPEEYLLYKTRNSTNEEFTIDYKKGKATEEVLQARLKQKMREFDSL